jgi:hypothetical protein
MHADGYGLHVSVAMEPGWRSFERSKNPSFGSRMLGHGPDGGGGGGEEHVVPNCASTRSRSETFTNPSLLTSVAGLVLPKSEVP